MLLLVVCMPCVAQITGATSAATESLAGSATGRIEVGCAAIFNPAAVDFNARSSVHLYGTPSPVGLEGVTEVSIVTQLPLSKDLSCGISISAYGESRFLESSIAGSLAFLLTDRFAAGARLHLHSTAISGYPMLLSTSADIGVLARISAEVRAGIAVANLLRAQPAGRPIQPEMRLGVAADLDSVSILSVDLIQEIGREPALASGFSYRLARDVIVRAGFATEPFTLSCGGAIVVGEISVELANAWIAQAGLRHTIGTGFRW